MRKIRDVLRMRQKGTSQRDIAAAVKISTGSVHDYLARAREAKLEWAEAESLSDSELEARLFVQVGRNEPKPRYPIDFEWVEREMRRAGVTLQLLWVEYRDAAVAAGDHAQPYGYSQFCDNYRVWRKRLPLVMRQEHRAGEKLFVDYSGKKLHLTDAKTGIHTDVELFVAVLGASNYTYAEATLTQRVPDWLGSHVRAFEYFGRVPAVLVPDQLRSAVMRAARHDPDIQTAYAELAKHYDTVVIPARPKKPRDKAKVEVGVQVVQRWIVARLRNRTFFTLAELNAAITELLEDLNTRPFQKLEGCRRSAFESIDLPAMKALPADRFTPAEWKGAKSNIDYHVEYDDRLYSVHHTLARQPVEIRATATTVEILHDGKRIASHLRSYGPKGTAVTVTDHRPKSHRDYGEWPPSRLVGWAASIGTNTTSVVEAILAAQPHPEHGYRSCLALFRDAKTYGRDRTEAACARALAIGSPTRKSVAMILKRGLDRLASDDAAPARPLPAHENVRGAAYYDTSRSSDREPPPDGTVH